MLTCFSFLEHDSFYRAGKADFEKFVEYMNATIPERVDDTIPELPIKDLVSMHISFNFISCPRDLFLVTPLGAADIASGARRSACQAETAHFTAA
jgi:hypothetical protein